MILHSLLLSLLLTQPSPTEQSVRAPAPLPDGFEITRLHDDVVVITTQPFAANSLLVRTANGVLLVDSPTTPADTEALLDWIEAEWGGPVTHAITSHWHADASAGNQILIARGVEVVSSEKTANLLSERGESMREELLEMFAENPQTAAEIAEFHPTLPARVVRIDQRLSLNLAGEPIVLIDAGPSHSADSIGVFIPRLELLYGGCAVRSNGKIVNSSEADLENWPRVMEAFEAEKPRWVIPGHGRRFDPAMLAESIAAANEASALSP
ncbi:MAG: MBL fold metallo-hydrolase [Thermoanaerobaculia bacterium]|nr:MBL fold metallo-hydrolase [Thermoanaerobaculia bacterium]